MNIRTNMQLLGFGCSLLLLVCAGPASAAQPDLPYTTATRYSLGGKLTGTIEPNPGNGHPATRYIYGPQRLLLRVESGVLGVWQSEDIEPRYWSGFDIHFVTEYTYDQYGRKATERLIGMNGGSASLVQYSYDSWSRIDCKAVRMNPSAYGGLPSSACDLGAEGGFGPDRITRYTYDALDQVLTEERAVGVPGLEQTYVANTYNHRLLSSQTDANGNRTKLEYDDYGRLKRRDYPSPTATGDVNENDYNSYEYDNNGNLIWERKRDGSSITYTYDANNRPIFKDLSNNTYSQDISYDYDLRGLTLSSRFDSDAGQGITNTFDGFGRLTSVTTTVGGTSRSLSYQYDANGNRTRITHPDGQYFHYDFDALDRLIGIGESTTSLNLLTLDYHRGGGRWHIYRPGGATTEYLQDHVKRLESFTQDFAGSSNDLTNSFLYNPANQITQLTRSNELYSLHGMVNRTGAYVANGLNQYTSIAGQPVSYDANGNLTSIYLPNEQIMSYTYDMENRLVTASGMILGESINANFTWDPLGRLHQVTINGTSSQFLYDGDALVAEFSGATMTRRYVHSDQVDEPLVQYDSATVGASYRRYLHADHQGSIIAQSSDTGGVLFRNAYDPYGIPAVGNEGRFGYTGQAWLKELGLYHYKARMYHPKIGRFLQTDPIFYADDMNMYAYAKNDPPNNTDPSGKICVPCVTGAIGAVVGAAAEGIKQFKAEKFDSSKLLTAAAKGGLIGFGAGAGGAAATLIKGADAFTVAMGTAVGAGLADLTTSQAVDVIAGEVSVLEVKLGEREVLGAMKTAAFELVGIAGGKAAGELTDGVRALAAGTTDVTRNTATEVGAAVGSNIAGKAAESIATDFVCQDIRACQ